MGRTASPTTYPSPPHSPTLDDMQEEGSSSSATAPRTTNNKSARSSSQTPSRPTPFRSRSSASSGIGTGGMNGNENASGSGSGNRRRPSNSYAGGGAAGAGAAPSGERVAISPPRDPRLFDTEEDWKAHHEEQEKTSGLHHLPLILVALPPLGAIVHGRAENWTDGIILVLVCFYLYHLIKIPWDIYYASHARYVIPGSTSKAEDAFDDPIASTRRSHAARALRQAELLSLLMTIVVPVLGSILLFYVRGILSDPDRYINKFVISLFALATAVKPLLHLSKLIKNNSLYYQSAVWYPSTEVHTLRRRLEMLESDLAQLTRAFATKEDVRNLRDGVDIPLTQLSKAVRRFDKKEEYLRLSAEERFALLDARMEEAVKELSANAELIDRMRLDQEQASHPITTVLRFFFSHVLGPAGQKGPRVRPALRWFQRGPMWYLFLPVNVSSMAIEWVATKAEGEEPEEAKMPHGRGVVKLS